MESNEAKKPQVLYRILTGRKLADIAAELDVSVRSIQRWLDEPEFADAIREEHQAACRVAIAQARTEMAADLEEGQLSRTLLVQIRNDELAPIHARIRCAALLMARADRWTRGMGVSPMSTAAAKTEQQETKSIRQIDTHGPEVLVFDENRKSTHATSSKPRQKATENDTAVSSPSVLGDSATLREPAQKPRQKTTENDKTPRPDVPKCSVSFNSVLCASAPLREPIQKPRQNTTKSDTLRGDPPSQPLQNLAFSNPFVREKEQTLAKLKEELDKLNEIEETVTDAARSRNAQDSAAMHEFKAQVGDARAKLMDAILAVEEASAQEFEHSFRRTEPRREAMSV